jgi:hypothetical protein
VSYLNLTTTLVSWAMFLSGVELLLMTRDSTFFRVWNFKTLEPDLAHALRLPPQVLKFLFSNKSLIVIGFIQVLSAIMAYKFPGPELFIALFICQLLVSLRCRGTLNGGSDMMTFVLLTGVLIAYFGSQKFGFLYIAINGLYSYIKAGVAKIKHPDWREGKALGTFSPSLMPWSKLLSWPVILFELLAVAVPFVPGFAWPYFILAMIFHFINFLLFGLNRFFWIWLSAWPSIFYLARLQTH